MNLIPEDVARFLGQEDDPTVVALAGEHLPIVAAMVRRYVRGAGFTAGNPDNDLAAVIVSACSRSVSNPSGTIMETLGDFTVRPGIFAGWTLPELAILHSYRKRSR